MKGLSGGFDSCGPWGLLKFCVVVLVGKGVYVCICKLSDDVGVLVSIWAHT